MAKIPSETAAPIAGRGWRATVDGDTTSLVLTTDWTIRDVGVESGLAAMIGLLADRIARDLDPGALMTGRTSP